MLLIRKSAFLTLCILLLVGSLSPLNATHIVGGELTYNCLGNNQFRITLNVYRDCFTGGAQFDSPARVTIYRGDNLINPLNTFQVFPSITEIPAETDNPCLIPPPNICVEQGTYGFIADLPFNPDGYYISYERCCRNPTINNIQFPNTVGATYTTFISELAQTTCNDSPVFNEFPPIVICENQPINFDHSAFDAEGDSLVYTFCAPFVGASQTNPAPLQASPPPYNEVTFIDPPYSAQFPMGGSPPVTIDSTTGLITGTPTVQGQFVVGVCVEEYRDGVLLSTIRRDFQFNVTQCIQNVNADIEEDELIGIDQFVVNECGDSVVTFINESQDVNFIDVYAWSFDLGDTIVTSSLQNPTITFPDTGLYIGMLILNPGNEGCTDTAAIFTNIFPPIEADFEFVYDTCSPSAIPFTDLSMTGASNLDTWSWNFGDGNFSNLPNPVNQFEDPAIYEVSLEVTDVNNCSDFLTQTIEWFPAPVISFTTDTTEGCEPLTVQFQNTSVPFDNTYTVEWDFGDGQTDTLLNPVHTYDSTGLYTVILTATSPDGCVSTDTFPDWILVHDLPEAFFTFQYDSCAIDSVYFFDQSNYTDGLAADWLWDFGDSTTSTQPNPGHLYADAGSYPVTLTIFDEFGCESTFSQTVDWFPAPIIEIVPSIIGGCAPLSVEFENNSYPLNGYTTIWDLGDGSTSNAASPIHEYPDPGLYTVSVTITSPTNCVETDTFFNLIRVDTLPTANFTFAYDSCAIEAVDFFDQTIAGTGEIIAWDWSFGDDSTSTDQNPAHLYADAGSYDVELIVTNTAGCQDTISQTVDWFPAPIIDIIPSIFQGCKPLTVEFENNSYPLNGYTTIWDLGDGSTSNAASPIHEYPEPGLYTVSVTITSPTNCVETSTFTDLIRVDTLPIANFAFVYDSCAIDAVQFFDQSIAGTGDIIAWDWSFGDDSTSTEQNPAHLYADAGSYDVELIITNTTGCQDTLEQTVEWFPAPIIEIVPSNLEGCAPLSVEFANNSYPLNGYTTIWDLGDGSTSNAASPIHVYENPGVYTVTVTITSPTNCVETDTFVNLIRVDTLPVANFDFIYDTCAIAPILFQDSSLSGSGDLVTWEWDFGDDSTSTEQSPTYQYAEPGDYLVELVIFNSFGCTDTISKPISWYPSTAIDVLFSDTRGCSPHSVEITNNSWPLNGYTELWDFGDGFSTAISAPSHIYPFAGTYTITYTTVSPNGCIATEVFVDAIVVDSIPIADFSSIANADSCTAGPVLFSDTSIPGSGAITNWDWDFGDGQFSTEQNPVHQFSQAGVFDVKLTVLDENGCTDSTTQTVIWAPVTTFDIIPSDQRGCTPHTVFFENNSFPSNGYEVFWEYSDGGTDTILSPTHTFLNQGIYDVTLTMVSPLGCEAQIIFEDYITVDTIPTANFTWDQESCAAGFTNFTDLSIPNGETIIDWQWDFGDGTIDTVPNPLHAFPALDTFDVTLIVTDFYGCMDTITQAVPWFPPADIQIEVDDYLGCAPHTVNFTNVSIPLDGYDVLWEFGDGNSSIEPNPMHIYALPGNYDVTVTMTSPLGCAVSRTFANAIRITEKPIADFSFNPLNPSNFDPEVTFTDASQNANNWYWDFGTGDDSFMQNPVYSFPDTGMYQVTLLVTQLSGCQDSITQVVDVEPLFTFFLPNAFTPNEDGLNDGFRGTGITYTLSFFEMTIWNRWGDLLFTTNNPEEAWNGRPNNSGRLSPSGVYVYNVRLRDGRGKEHEYKGFVTLVK